MNIKQKTNYSEPTSTTQKRISRFNNETKQWEYVYYPYKTFNFEDSVVKLGYCCENKAIIFPIFITINNKENEFQIGKTGMFEFQPETWQDINNETEEQIAEVLATQIKVPDNIEFVLDYCY